MGLHAKKQMAEIKIQAEIFQWHWNNHPLERGLLCYNLNNSANKIQGNQNKALGLIAGRSDLVFYYMGIAYMIEIKTETGTQQPAQKKWEETIKAQGFKYYIVRSLEEFKILRDKIIKL